MCNLINCEIKNNNNNFFTCFEVKFKCFFVILSFIINNFQLLNRLLSVHCFSSLTSRLYWRWTTRRTTASGRSSTWTPLTCESPPLLPHRLRARLKMTAWMSMSGDQVGDRSLTK